MRASHKAKAGKATCFCTVPSGRSSVPWRRAEWLRRRPSEPQVSGPSQKVPPLVTKQEKDVVVAARIPRSRARGESPAGRWHARPQAQRRGCGHGREPGLTSAQSAALWGGRLVRRGWPQMQQHPTRGWLQPAGRPHRSVSLALPEESGGLSAAQPRPVPLGHSGFLLPFPASHHHGLPGSGRCGTVPTATRDTEAQRPV